MINKQITLDITTDKKDWLEKLDIDYSFEDYIILAQNDSDLNWFCSNLIHLMANRKESELGQIYGVGVNSFTDFTNQISSTFPWGFKIKPNYQSLYDILLNFETQPKERIMFWNNSENLLNQSKKEFSEIFEAIVVSGYCNRNAISTELENGIRYQVNQRCFFFFKNVELNDLDTFLNKKYYIPSLDEKTRTDIELGFNIVRLKS